MVPLANLYITSFRFAAALLLAAALAPGARAAGPSVPYVPTPQDVVERMLQIAKVTANDYLIDLGSGDGRIVVTAARKHGARGFGVDLSPERIKESNEDARKAGVTDKIAFYQRDLFETDLSEATVITMYLLPRVNMDLRPKLLALQPGTRIVSHDFSMEDWKPDTHVTVDVQEKFGGSGGKSDIYFWVIPARVGGTWQWQLTVAGKPQAYELALDQKFQMVTGNARVNGQPAKLQGVTLRGGEIHVVFTADVNGSAVKHEFTGKVEGDAISGSVSLSGARLQSLSEWNARRAAQKSASLFLR